MNYTEDDTFEALRRIPQSQVREKLDELSVWFQDHRESYHAGIAYDRRMRYWNKLRRFVGLGTYRVRDYSNPLLEEEMEEKLKGTGWTIESYAEVIDKPIIEQLDAIQAVRVKRRTYMLCAMLLMLALGVLLATSLGVAWTQGLLVGLQLCNIVTVTYYWVADKFFPYPSYHYRYE